MGNIQITQFPFNNSPSSGAITMIIDNGTYYQTPLSLFSGSGINTGQYYLVTNPNQFCTSGNLNSTGSILQLEIVNASGYLLSLINNATIGVSSLNTLSGNLFLQGSGSVSITSNSQNIIISGNTGIFYLVTNPNNFSSSGNIQTTGTTLQNEIFGLSGQLNQTGNYLYNLISSISGSLTGIGYGYMQPNPVVVDFASTTSGSYINTPLIGNNIMPINAFSAGDIYLGEFSYNCMQFSSNLNQTLLIKIQNNIYSGVFGGTTDNEANIYTYKIYATSPSQLYLTPITAQYNLNLDVQHPFAVVGGDTPPYTSTGVSINNSQPCKIDLIGIIPTVGASSGIMYYSFLKKI